MKWILIGLLFVTNLWAENSKLVPVFIDAAKIYVDGSEGDQLFLKPEIRAALDVLKKSQIDPAILQRRLFVGQRDWPLPPDDKYDQWVNKPQKSHLEVPEVALHAFKFNVVDESDEWFKDDIYVYFFITDGVIPTGKVTSIYKGVSQGQSFFFNEVDRAIFPLLDVPAKKPENHLIVDYGIIESDGDDVKDMQKLSSVIIDIAISVYSSIDPQGSQVIVNLRKEIKALTEMLLNLNNDDRQAIGSFGWKVAELEALMKDQSYVEFSKNHKGNGDFNKWEYEIYFRLLKK